MKSNVKSFAIIPLLILAILIAGCKEQGPSCPTCPAPLAWGECGEGAVKTRTNYQCSAETNFECQGYEEREQCRTQVTAKGTQVELFVSPSLDNNVRSIVTLELRNAPENTDNVAFAIQGAGIEDLSVTGPNLGRDASSNDGWTYILDTSRYGNGVYDISGIAFKKDQDAPLDAATAQVIIKN